MSLWKIAGGTVHDPRHGIDGQVMDLWIEDARIVAPPTDPDVKPSRTLDARGLVVMPGGVDMHCHIASSKVNAARKMLPEDKDRDAPLLRRGDFHSGVMGSVPSTFATGYHYAGLGYTTAFDAAVAPLGARHTHQQFADTPCLDAGFFVLVGNNHFVLECLKDRDLARLRNFLGWLLKSTRAYAPKVVNPGGVEMWKRHREGNVRDLDEKIDHFDVTPRQILQGIAGAAAELDLPHPLHLHCNNLGLPGNWTTTLETMRSLEGRRAHLTHIQFHSYSGGEADEGTFGSGVAPLVEYFNAHDNLTVDVGQVLFGRTTSMTGDGPVGYYLANLYGSKWYSNDLEIEAGCGIAPIEYKHKSLVHAWQWAIGLEWYLLAQDPWRIAMSTDHPNGGSFLAYPEIIRLLMDRTYRRDVLQTVHPKVREQSALRDLDREYTLQEICIITRAAPAKMLGLDRKGHLGPGADADITLYTPDENPAVMFQLPRYVIQSGRTVIEDSELRNAPIGETVSFTPDYDRDIEPHLERWFNERYSLRFANYGVSDEEMQRFRL